MARIGVKRKSNMTLLEIMIVIFIIGIISSVIGYNMKGSLEKAKAFKTKEGIKKIREIFELEMAQGDLRIQDVVSDAKSVLKSSGLVSNVNDMLKDGWGNDYKISMSKNGREILIASDAYDRFMSKQAKLKKQSVSELLSDDSNDDDHEDQE